MKKKQGKTEYQEYFDGKMKGRGISSPDELEGEEKKKFFEEVDKGWQGRKESRKLRNHILEEMSKIKDPKDLRVIAKFGIQKSAKLQLGKEATDKMTKEYYTSYFGDYGKELSRPVTDVAPSSDEWEGRKKKKSPGWESETGYREMGDGPRDAAKLHRLAKGVKNYPEGTKELTNLAEKLEG
jgi:hypothetical protein